MTDADRKRLAAILGMLGSSSAGERDAAALQAEAFRRKHGLTWDEVINGKEVYLGGNPPWHEPPAPPPPPQPPPPEPPAWAPPTPKSAPAPPRAVAEPWEAFWCVVTVALPFAIWGSLFWLATLSH